MTSLGFGITGYVLLMSPSVTATTAMQKAAVINFKVRMILPFSSTETTKNRRRFGAANALVQT
jgi:hypothetical protein